MLRPEKERPILVQEIVDVLLEKFERLPVVDRNTVVIASVEAVAWLAAMEVESCKAKKELTDADARKRFEEYIKLFATVGAEEMNADKK